MTYEVCSLGSVQSTIAEVTENYEENMPGARERLSKALEIIVIAYYAALIKRHSDSLLEDIFGKGI
jgi:hypothetical protein